MIYFSSINITKALNEKKGQLQSFVYIGYSNRQRIKLIYFQVAQQSPNYCKSRITSLELLNILKVVSMKRNIYAILALLFIIGTISIRIEDYSSDKLDQTQADSSDIEWETVDIDDLTEEEKDIDEAIRGLVRDVQDYNLTDVRIDNGTLDHFIFQYSDGDNHTITIKGGVQHHTIRFTTPEGRRYSETTRTIEKPNGEEFNLTTISSSFNFGRKGRHSFRRSTAFSSFSFIS